MAEIVEELAPSGEDERSGDKEYNPAVEPDKAKAWLNLLQESEKAFEEWNDACDNIEKLYANLGTLRSMSRDRQFNLFWANLEILKPSIYAKSPVPVVVPKFKDRKPLYQTTSELAGAVFGRGVRPDAHQRLADAGAGRSGDVRSRRGVVPL